MKKRIISITIFVMSFFILYGVKAIETQYTAADVNYKYIEYKNAMSEYSANNCDGTLYTKVEVNKCNSLGLTKSQALTYLFNAREYDKSLISDEINKVLESNKEQCGSIISSTLQDAINKVYILFYIAGPILLILFGSVDLTSAVVAGDEKKRKSAYRRFIRRTIALVLLFAAPVLVNILVNTFGMKKVSGNKYACKFSEKKITLSYISRKRGSGNYGPSTGSKLENISGDHDAVAGSYVVIDTKYPGGLQGFSDMVRSNGITQDEDTSAWGQCCAGFAQAHACGLQNGMSLTKSGLGLKHGDDSCNGISGGCSGIWAFNSDHCFATEEEYMQYVISNIQQGVPVMTVVKVGGSSAGRHFVTIVGYKSNTKGTDANDLLFIDSWDGYLGTIGESRRKGSNSTVVNHPCESVSGGGEYWASANRN
ncbi:MAG: hypothetical protein IKZ96_01445 [Bacilli bacterium]|nr:hypothetical protein [Bacilli bacterium]